MKSTSPLQSTVCVVSGAMLLMSGCAPRERAVVLPPGVQAQTIGQGIWRGTMIAPSIPGAVLGDALDVSYELVVERDELRITLVGPFGNIPMRDIRVDGERLRFSFVGEPSPPGRRWKGWFDCELELQEDHSYRGDCKTRGGGFRGAAGNVPRGGLGRLVMIPPGDPSPAGASTVDQKLTIRELFTLDAPNAYVAFSPDGQLLATGARGANPDTPGELKLWDLATGEELALLMGHFGGIGAVAFSPDGKSLATGGLDTTVKLWDVATREERNTLRGHSTSVLEAVFSPDGKTLATSTGTDPQLGYEATNEIRLWDAQTGEARAILGMDELFWTSYYALAFSPDGKVLATGSGHIPTPGGRALHGRLTLWDLASGEGHMVLREDPVHEAPPGPILAVAFTPDGKVVASGGSTRIPRLWDVASRRELRALPRQGNWIYALAFSPDGKILVTGTGSTLARSSPGEVKLWDTATGKELAAVDTDGHGVMSVAFSPDGKKLAVGMFDGNTKIWGITTENTR